VKQTMLLISNKFVHSFLLNIYMALVQEKQLRGAHNSNTA